MDLIRKCFFTSFKRTEHVFSQYFHIKVGEKLKVFCILFYQKYFMFYILENI
jgi:hypothetical protein